MEAALITGGTGFIGRHLVKSLARSGVKCFVTGRTPLPSTDAAEKYIQCDLATPNCGSILSPYVAMVDVVFHIAALIPRAGATQESISSYVSSNVSATGYLLDTIAESMGEGLASIRAIVSTSTLDVYGIPERIPIKEDDPAKPNTAYAVTKLCAEHLLRFFEESYHLPVAILRLSHVYGPGEPVIKVIPRFITGVVRNEPPQIYGDGQDMRDYVYVDDVIDALIKAAERAIPGTVNVSSGRGHTIREVAEEILQISGKQLVPVYNERRQPATKIVIDNHKATEQLNWIPKTSLHEGLAQHYAHVQKKEGN